MSTSTVILRGLVRFVLVKEGHRYDGRHGRDLLIGGPKVRLFRSYRSIVVGDVRLYRLRALNEHGV